MRTSLMLRWISPAFRRRKSAFLLSTAYGRGARSRDRVRAAIRNSGFSLPPTPHYDAIWRLLNAGEIHLNINDVRIDAVHSSTQRLEEHLVARL